MRWMIAVHYWPIWIRGLLKNNCSGREVSSIKEMSGKFQDKKIMQKLFRILLLQTAMIINTGKQTWHISFNFAPTKLTTKVVALVEIQASNLTNLPCHWRTIAHVFFLQNGHVSNSCSFICCYYYCLAECFVLTIMSPSDDISGYKGCKKILLAKSKRRNHPTKQFHNLFFNLKNLKHKISQYSKTSENIDQCETHCSGGRFDPWIGTTKKMIYF